jgi:hypothetical protein
MWTPAGFPVGICQLRNLLLRNNFWRTQLVGFLKRRASPVSYGAPTNRHLSVITLMRWAVDRQVRVQHIRNGFPGPIRLLLKHSHVFALVGDGLLVFRVGPGQGVRTYRVDQVAAFGGFRPLTLKTEREIRVGHQSGECPLDIVPASDRRGIRKKNDGVDGGVVVCHPGRVFEGCISDPRGFDVLYRLDVGLPRVGRRRRRTGGRRA